MPARRRSARTVEVRVRVTRSFVSECCCLGYSVCLRRDAFAGQLELLQMSWEQVLEQENWAPQVYCLRHGVAVLLFRRERGMVTLVDVRVNLQNPKYEDAYP